MSTPYAGNPATYPANIRLVDDGEPASAAFLGLCAQDLADRTANLKARLDAAGVGDGSSVATAISRQVVAEQIVRCVGRAGAITITLPAAADAPIGRAVLIVEGSNDATAINIAPHAGDTIYTARTAITFGKDSVLAKKISATVWILIYQDDFDIHTFAANVTANVTANASAIGEINFALSGPFTTYTGAGPIVLTNDDQIVVINTATAGVHVQLPAIGAFVGFCHRILTTAITTASIRDHLDAVIVNNASNVSVMHEESCADFTWNGAVWIRSGS